MKSGEGIGTPEAEVPGGCEPPGTGPGNSLGPLKEQQVF